ncbi:hypothetical protein [Thiothrix sp.]|uniref:hypothetical protein n=1 Tax=Thiothrix sp. TaxID=1032 RepID=UPI00257AF3C5|nr:hypothetical protein [Thiothrix sp.]
MTDTNQHQTATTQKVAYWNNGAWTDPDTAALAVELEAFTDDYQIAEFPIDADPSFIDGEVWALLAKQQEERVIA